MKHGGNIRELKYDNNYILGHKGNNIHDKLLKTFWIMKNKLTKIIQIFCH